MEITDPKEIAGFFINLINNDFHGFKERAAKMENPTQQNVIILLSYCMNENRLRAFEWLANHGKLNPKTYGAALRFAYTMANGREKNTLKFFKKAERAFLMNAKELETLRNLPDTVTICRGTSLREAAGPARLRGISYTLDMKTAYFFAFEHCRKAHKREDGAVIVSKINKSEILAYIDERNEREIIIDPKEIDVKAYTLQDFTRGIVSYHYSENGETCNL